MLQKTTNGNLLKLTAGSLVKECCCGGASPSVCSNGDPEIYLTIFQSGYSGGNITWCGQVFTPTMIQNGTEQASPVCPTTYFKGQTSAINPYVGRNTWGYNASLVLLRAWSGFTPNSTFPARQQNLIRINNTNLATYRVDNMIGTFTSFQIGVLTAGVTMPTFNSYAILNAFFGSYTEAGIQYSWRRGNGW